MANEAGRPGMARMIDALRVGPVKIVTKVASTGGLRVAVGCDIDL